jgi:hypothetical protein
MSQLLKIPSGVVRDHEAARIERLAQVGATPEDIAAELQMPLKRLHKRFRRELERGAVRGKHDVLEKLFENASSGASVTATSLWVKARCGWRDTGSGSNSPTVIQSVLEIVTKRARPNEKQSEGSS